MNKVMIDLPQEIYEAAKNNRNYLPLSQLEIVWKALADGVLLSTDTTNGEILQALYPDCVIKGSSGLGWIETNIDNNTVFDYKWWTGPYKGGRENDKD